IRKALDSTEVILLTLGQIAPRALMDRESPRPAEVGGAGGGAAAPSIPARPRRRLHRWSRCPGHHWKDRPMTFTPTRRSLLAAAAVAAPVAALSACGGGGGDARNADGKIELTMAGWSIDSTPEFTVL